MADRVPSPIDSVTTMTPYKRPVILQPPMLLVVRQTPTGGQELGFFNLFLGEFAKLAFPGSLQGHRCCGCREVWLIMVSDSALQLSLYNIFSRAQVSLPSEPQCSLGSKYENPPICRVTKAILSAPPTDCNCIIAAMAGYNIILLCRPGYTEWTVFEVALDGVFEDITFRNGQLCAITSTGKLTIITLDSQLRGTVKMVVQPWPDFQLPCSHRYLVETTDSSSSTVFAVIKRYIPPDLTFVVFKLDGDKWIPWLCSSDYCLFVGVIRCELIPVKEVRGVQARCVYFANKLAERIAPNGVGMYFFDDRRVEPFAIPQEVRFGSMYEPVWVKPTLYY